MPASVSVSDLAWSLPDGRVLFSHLSLNLAAERTGLVGRNGVGKTTLLKLISGELRPHSGAVAVSGSVGVLRQTVQANDQETIADHLGIRDQLAAVRRIEAGLGSDAELEGADWMLETRLQSALSRVGLDAGPETLLSKLSGGQRTRVALAALIFREPDFLLLDEPTNNLDRDGRRAVTELLSGWRGGAIVVSHDRELLETMDALVELSTLGANCYGGNWSAYRARKVQELAAAERDLATAEKRLSEVARVSQATVERQARRSGTGKAKAAKGGIPRIILGGLKDKSEGTTGAQARQAEQRRDEATDAADQARKRIEVLQPLTVQLPPTNLHASKSVLKTDRVTSGYIVGQPVLRDFSLSITGPERVAITGPNGSGKSTLLALVTGRLQSWSGTVRTLTDFALLDQQVSLLEPSQTIRENFLRMNAQASENACRASLARFMFRADAALQTVATLSGGQLLRAGLACVLGGAKPPQLLILDEPTNHLDIDSIESVEAGLRAYDGALLVVSHDETFLQAIGITRQVKLQSLADAPRQGSKVAWP